MFDAWTIAEQHEGGGAARVKGTCRTHLVQRGAAVGVASRKVRPIALQRREHVDVVVQDGCASQHNNEVIRAAVLEGSLHFLHGLCRTEVGGGVEGRVSGLGVRAGLEQQLGHLCGCRQRRCGGEGNAAVQRQFKGKEEAVGRQRQATQKATAAARALATSGL